MSILERLKPDPIPAIHPMPEYLTTGQRAEWYEDTKQVLQVPWMGVVTMAYADYPTFFGELWRGLKPLCQNRHFVEAFMNLSDFVESRTAELNPTSVIEPLTTMGYAPREIDAIRQMNTVFSHGNQLYVLIATILHAEAFGSGQDHGHLDSMIDGAKKNIQAKQSEKYLFMIIDILCRKILLLHFLIFRWRGPIIEEKTLTKPGSK